MDFWHKQTDKPLFPDLLWSRPENKKDRGKLLIIGGSASNFSNVARLYTAAEKAAAGTIRVLVPDSLAKITKGLPNIEYAPSNPSGGFAKSALSELLNAHSWADGILLAGDLGKNSETSLLLQAFIQKSSQPLIIDVNSLESIGLLKELLERPVILCLTMPQLQRLAIELRLTKPITSSIGASQLAESLHDITKSSRAIIVTEHDGVAWVSGSGEVYSSPLLVPVSSAMVAVWTIQHPKQCIKAIVSSLI